MRNIVLGALAILFLALSTHCDSPLDQGRETAEETRREISLDSLVVTGEDTLADAVVTCSGSIMVEDGGLLVLDNVLLYMCDSIYGIYVEPHSKLIIQRGSKLTVLDPDKDRYRFWYKQGSTGRIEDSDVEYTWTPDPGGKSQFNEAGLFIEAHSFTIRNSTFRHSYGNGIEVFGADTLTIINSRFVENGANGLLIRNSANISVSKSTFSYNGTDTSRVDGSGLIVLVASGAIDSCTIESNRFSGLEVSGEAALSITGCRVGDNSFGIFVHDEFSNSTVEVSDNTIVSNGDSLDYCSGICIEGAIDCIVRNNLLERNFIGVRVLNNTGSCRVERNSIRDCPAYGIHVDNSSPVFYLNTVSGCKWAAFIQDTHGIPHPLFGDTGDPNTGHNDFSGNESGIRNDSSVSDIKAENNYWGYTSAESIDSYNFIDDTPLDFTPWLNSPPDQ